MKPTNLRKCNPAIAGQPGAKLSEHQLNQRGTEIEITPAAPLMDPTKFEQEELERCEGVIARGLHTFFEVGHALARIKELRLYRCLGYQTFEQYCEKKWDMSKVHAYRLLQSAATRAALAKQGLVPLPQNEAQARPLLLLPPQMQIEAWRNVVSSMKGEKLTAKLVSRVVGQMNPSRDDSHQKKQPSLYWQERAMKIWKEIGKAIDRRDKALVLDKLERLWPIVTDDV